MWRCTCINNNSFALSVNLFGRFVYELKCIECGNRKAEYNLMFDQ